MERAAKAVRRSGVKLLSLGGGHGELNMVISEQKDVKNTAKAFMAAQNSAAQYLVKWATNEENRAIQDVSHHITELNQIWTEAQRDFVEQLKEFKHMFDLVLDGEKQVDYAKGNFMVCEQREVKIKKELKKVAKKATPDELRILESRLAQAERQKDLAVLEVEDKIRENEAVKLIRFKDGYTRLSTAYMEMSRKCNIIFEAQRDITTQLPDAYNGDLGEFKYTGSGATKQFVVRAKERVRQYKRQQKGQGAVTMPALDDVEPPPPYTPGDFYDLCYDSPYPPITGDLPHIHSITSRQVQPTAWAWQSAVNTRQTQQEPQSQEPRPQEPQASTQKQQRQQQKQQQHTQKQQQQKQQQHTQKQQSKQQQQQQQQHTQKQPSKQQQQQHTQKQQQQELFAQPQLVEQALQLQPKPEVQPQQPQPQLQLQPQPQGLDSDRLPFEQLERQEQLVALEQAPPGDVGEQKLGSSLPVAECSTADSSDGQPGPTNSPEYLINDLNWCSEDEDAYLSGAMGGVRL